MPLTVVGLFFYIAGLIIGLGGVTVIQILAWLGRNNNYWSEATVRAHRVTKPLIWFGALMALSGASLFYRGVGLTGLVRPMALVALVLFVNGFLLTAWLSPRLLQREKAGLAQELLPQEWKKWISFSLILATIVWWSEVFLLVLFLYRHLTY